MNNKFSKRTGNVKASEIRELLKLTEAKEIISFAGGLPAEETFPVEEMKTICEEVLTKYGVDSMQYTVTEGNAQLIKLICNIMKEKACICDKDSILVTSGSQQGLDLTAKVLVDEGDIILCEGPTYLSAINAFKPFYPTFVELKMDEEGILLEDLEEKLKTYKNIKLLYTIPDYQNPTGIKMSLDRRKGIITLANRYDFLIVEDNPYSELNYNGEIIPPIKSLDTEDRVIYLSTFSKIVCPGFRIGWVCASQNIIRKYVLFKQGTDLHTNIFSQMLIVRFFEKYDVKEHIKKSIVLYKARKDTMLQAIKKYFPENISYTRPEGGLFLWVTLPETIDAGVLLNEALVHKVAFVPGCAFYPNGGHKNTLRLNFSSSSESQIVEGIKRLGQVMTLYV